MEKKQQEVAEEYLSSLADLNLNSKPLINMLTILAEENIEYASVIVKAVEQHIAKVDPDVKLPVLYLIDSIVKNVGREYIQLFSHCIVNIFCSVFEKVNEKIREKMYTLRQTWNDVFTPQKLYTLDVKVNCMDPNWPITAKVVPKSPAIHVNPNFLKNQSEPLNEMQEKLRDKQRQLLELQKRKLELELAATRKRLEEQEKHLNQQAESVKQGQQLTIQQPTNTSIRPPFNHFKHGLIRPSNVHISAGFNNAGNHINKTRVNPINPTMLNCVRFRDPRLARQQQVLQQQLQKPPDLQAAEAITLDKESSSTPKNESNKVDVGPIIEQRTNDNFVYKKNNDFKSPKNKNIVNYSGNNHKKLQTRTSNVDKTNENSNRSSSGRSKNSRSIQPKHFEKESRDKDKNNVNDKKRSAKTDSPIKKIMKSSPSKIEQVSSTIVDDSLKSLPSDILNSSQTKFKEIKQNLKSRNYVRRNRDKPKIQTSDSTNTESRSYSSIEKRFKINDATSSNSNITSDVKNQELNNLPIISATNVKQHVLEKNIEPLLSKDVDLRQFQAISSNVSQSGIEDFANDVEMVRKSDEIEQNKKRISIDKSGEPDAKKTKSEKLDTLFGPEDVDLRTLNMSSNTMLLNSANPMTPPPPPIISMETENWAKVKGSLTMQVSNPKSNLDDVRAKLAKATKSVISKPEKSLKDLKNKSLLNDNFEDSQDGTDANIRTIITQAEELLKTENMNTNQFNTLVKTVIQINETNKLKEAQRRELLQNKLNSDLTPISDEEKFSSDDENVQKTKTKTKSIPESNAQKKSDTLMTIKETSNSPTLISTKSDNIKSYESKVSINNQRSRNKESKWSSWDQSCNPSELSSTKPWINNSNKFSQSQKRIHPPPLLHTAQNRHLMPNPWQNPPPLIFASPVLSTPPPPQPPPNLICPENQILPVLIASQLSNSVDNPKNNIMRTINIDHVPKEIRFYDEVAIAFMDWDQPKEIGFQSGQRRIIIDDRDTITIAFNDPYKTVLIEGIAHKIRFGCPTRELYIDDNWYECYFGDPPIGICIDGRIRVFKIEGPPPQVRIGNLRQDIVAGKINLIIDAHIIVPVFLDAEVQTFQLNSEEHKLQFADFLETVLLDGEPFTVEFGGLPKSVLLGKKKYFIRFGTLPNGVIPGKVLIKNMIKTDAYSGKQLPDITNEYKDKENLTKNKNFKHTDLKSPLANDTPVSSTDVNGQTITPTSEKITQVLPNVNIDELFQKLLASGILNQNPNEKLLQEETPNKKLKLEEIQPIDLTKPESIKKRQAGIVQKLICGMQCSSCGVRFPPEQTIKYSQHLDWHFRQNRRERDSSRRAHSRKWYYDLSDWIQYEEIEDLDEREKNWFETQQNEMDNVDEASSQRISTPPPSCPAGPDDVDKACDMCHDKFEQFYNEESEEWHLRCAIRIEGKIYHPLCYEDYKLSLESAIETNDNATDPLFVKKDETKEEAKEENEESNYIDDDDVIVIPIEEPSITEIPDDDEDDTLNITESSVKNDECNDENIMDNDPNVENDENIITTQIESIESDVEIQEPVIPFTDLDNYVETVTRSTTILDDSLQSSQLNNIKIKEEPKDDGYEDTFEDVGTFISAEDLVENVEEYVPHTTINATHEGLVSSIDGNMDIQEPLTANIGVNKIKININKNVTLNQKKNINTQESSSSIEVIVNTREPIVSSNINNLESLENNLISIPSTDDTSKKELNEEESIDFQYKPELQGIEFKKMSKVSSGLETSGLCSIM